MLGWCKCKKTLALRFVLARKKKRRNAEIAASQVARLKRQERYEEVLEHYRQGKSIPTIAQTLHMHHMTVRKFIAAGAFEDALSPHKSPLCSPGALSSLPGKARSGRVRECQLAVAGNWEARVDTRLQTRQYLGKRIPGQAWARLFRARKSQTSSVL